MRKEPVYKFNGRLYSNKYWTDDTIDYAGDVPNLIDLLVGKGKINIDTRTYYYLPNSDSYTEDPYELLEENLDKLGVKVEG